MNSKIHTSLSFALLALLPLAVQLRGELPDVGSGYAVEITREAGTTFIDQTTTAENPTWYWNRNVGGIVQPLMGLDATGRLAFFHPDDPTNPVILIDPSGLSPAIFVGGKRVLVEGNTLGGVILPETGVNLEGGSGVIVLAAATGGTEYGTGASASGQYSSAYGNFSKAVGHGSTSYGTESLTAGDFSSAFGFNSRATGAASSAMGNSSTASGISSIAYGNGARSLGIDSTAIGVFSEALTDASIAVGPYSSANSGISLAIGYQARADGNLAAAVGYTAAAVGKTSIAVGAGALSEGQNSLAVGGWAQTYGNTATSLGFCSFAKEHASVAVGAIAVANSAYQIVLGTANIPTDSNSNLLFILGNGTYGLAESGEVEWDTVNRSNALTCSSQDEI